MINTDFTAIRTALFTGFGRLAGVILLSVSLFANSQAQTTNTADGSTPLGLTPGAPAGSYALSGFDNVNLYNGNLNFRLPLANIGGRGGAGYTMMLPIERRWTVTQEVIPEWGVFNFPEDTWWSDDVKVGYGPGVLHVRYGGFMKQTCKRDKDNTDTLYKFTRTRLTFTGPDGTEFEMLSQLSGGQTTVPFCATAGASRGTIFVTNDGTSATFISDQTIYDRLYYDTAGPSTFVSGFLMLRDGTRYRINNGVVAWMRDRNGNRLTFTYEGFRRVTSITDSLNRQVTIVYDVNDGAPYGVCDRITVKGFGGATRIIRVSKTNLGSALRSDYSLQTLADLFLPLNGSFSGPHDPPVVSAVWLPDSDGVTRKYQFFYNSYAELARVVPPTGGAFEYDWAPGLSGGADGGAVAYSQTVYHIYRRVIEKRIYPDGVTLAQKMTFSRPETAPWTTLGYVVVDHLDAGGTLLARQQHYFLGDGAAGSLNQGPLGSSPWAAGREYQTDEFTADGATLLRRVAHTWQGSTTFGQGPHIIETTTTLSDTNQVARQTFSYDSYNNRTDVYEYDFGAGAPGPLIRRTHTPYLTTNGNQGNANYATDTNIHIRNLPIQKLVYDASGNLRSHTDFFYDNYGLPLVGRSGIVQHDGAFHTGYGTRGNLTGVILRNPGGSPSEIHLNNQYDVAGNLVKAVDGHGIPTDFYFDDSFGSPDDEAQSNAGAPELAGGFTYAFPTKVTNVLGHTAHTQYDYYLGAPVNTEDINGIVSSVAYNGPLDRPTQGIQARYKVGVGVPAERRQTTVTYDDANRVITTTSDLNTFNDNGLTAKSFYDGLGRTWRGAANEGATWTITDTQFDALGRVSQVSNPYRAADPSSASPPSGLWITTEYDALSRMIKVTTPDGAHVDTAYNGNQVTVTDQAGKKRGSETDAAGRLIKVIEDPGGLNYETTYLYDVLGNLRKVTQGAQTRWFSYDSLSRLIRVKNPEQNTNAGPPPHIDPVTGGSGWSMAYSYDANGNLTQRIDARGVTANYSYDALNRNTGIDYINGSQVSYVRRVYDGAENGKGRLHYDWTQEGSIPVTHTAIDRYDELGRPLNKRQHFWRGSDWGTAYAVQQRYDLGGNVKSLTYPSGRTVNYSYDQAGRLSVFSGNLGGSPRTYADTISYNAAGQMIKERFGTNTSLYHNSHYNNRQQLVDIRVGDSATDEWNWNRGAFAFFYGTTAVASGDIFANDTDNNGNLRRQINYVPLASGGYVIPQLDDYTYDGLNRISSFTEWQMDSSGQWTPNVASQNFSYDPYGNRQITAASGGGVSNYNPSYDLSTNRINGPGYDAAGNITSDPLTGGTMTYDGENRLLTATSGGGGNYVYNADGKRVRRITAGQEIWHVYGCGGELLAEYATGAQPTAPLKEYGYRGGQLLIIAESGSGGGVSLVKPASESIADIGGQAGPGMDDNADGLFEVDEAVADLEFDEDFGSTTADVSSNNNTGTHIDGVTGTTAEGYGNAPPANGVGGALLAEHPGGAQPTAPQKEYGYRRGLSLVPVQSVVSVSPGAYQTPNPGQGGAVASPSNTGHGSTTASAFGEDSQTKSCKWTGFQSVTGQILSITLKFDWTENGSFESGELNRFRVDYSLNGGSSWTYIFAHDQISASNSGSSQVSISVGQDITQVQVRDSLSADTFFSTASVTASISNIRLEVETDTTAPVISSVAAGGITASSATIIWNTNENSDSQVEYGPTTAYGQSTTLNPALVTAHSQGLSGLTSGTLYHYRVKSKDASGNLAVSGAFSFTTADITAPVISNVAAGGITTSIATITWTTNENSDSQVEYGPTTAYGQSTALNPALVTAHSQGLSGLTAGTLYHYRVKSKDAAGNLAVSGDFTFTTAPSGPDTTPPTVTSFSPAAAATNVSAYANVTVTFSEAMDAATVNGSTVELRDPSNALVSATVSYNAASLTATLDPTASLTAGVTYTARVRGGSTALRVKDLAGNALAADVTWIFTTAQSGSGGIKWLVTDHLGSTRMVIDETGSLAGIKRHDYSPFGEELSAGIGIRSASLGYGEDSVRQKFGSKERDNETGLDYFLARYFSSVQGRFTSPDEFTGGPTELFAEVAAHNPTFYADIADPQSLNKYTYCLNNPLKFIDPDGHQSVVSDYILSQAAIGVGKSAANAFISMDNEGNKILRALGWNRQDTEHYQPSNEIQAAVMGTTDKELVLVGFVGGKAPANVAMAQGRQAANISAKALEGLARAQLEKRFTVTAGRDITKTEAMADFIAVAKSGKSAVVQEVTTSADKSVSTIRAQLEGGIDHLIKQGFKGTIKPQVRVTDRRLHSQLQKELKSVRGRDVKLILGGQ